MTFTLTLKQLHCEIEDRVLFTGVNVTCESGDIVHLVGPNGAGKTTLLRILTGLFDHYEGDVEWCDQVAKGYDFLSHLLYIGHATGVKSSLTPMENLLWYFGLNGKKTENASDVKTRDVERALEKVMLAGYEEVPCYQLSAGQQRRVALARLFISQAPLWILDEPFTAIDKSGVAQLEARLIEHAQQGGIVILTTHQSPQFDQLKIVDLADFATRGVRA